MDQKHFRTILRRYLQGLATPEEEKIIDTWYSDMGNNDDSPPAEGEEEQRYWSAIHSHIARTKTRMIIPWKSVRIAASLLLVAASCIYLLLPGEGRQNTITREETEITNWELISNEGKASRRYVLADGSSVTLEPESQLKFPTAFGEKERVVKLDGEGFFDVSRDEKRPFLVQTSQLTTKVLGTSFRVRAFRNDKNVTVAVKTGKVSVSMKDADAKDETKAQGIILTPNQQIIFDKEQNTLSRMLVEKPEMVLPEQVVRQMRFEAAPVSEILGAIQEVYGVDIVFDEETFSSCLLTSVISDGDLYNRLDIICKAIGASYSLEENRIVITGRGCDYQ